MPDPIIRQLPVKLDTLERQQRAQELAQAYYDCALAEDAEAERKKAAKAKIEAMETETARLANIVRTGHEPRPVACEDIANIQRWTIDSMRLDTGECYAYRPMTHQERADASQLALGWPDKPSTTMAPVAGRNDPLPEAADRQPRKARKAAEARVDAAQDGAHEA